MNDVKCPECESVISFSNVMGFDDSKMKLLGIVYAIECKKCKTVFITPMRMSRKATKQQIKDINKKFKEAMKNV